MNAASGTRYRMVASHAVEKVIELKQVYLRVHAVVHNGITEIDASDHAHDSIQGQQVYCRRRHTRLKTIKIIYVYIHLYALLLSTREL
jgi:hypothetical protein